MSDEIITPLEQWIAIEGFGGFYSVSNFGRVRSIRPWRDKIGYKPKEKILKLWIQAGKYVFALLSWNGKDYTIAVHRLVLLSFAGPPPIGKPFCNHKNGIKNDNRIENLEWCSRSENALHARRVLGRRFGNWNRGEARTESKLTEESVRQIRELSKQKIAQTEIAKMFGVKQSAISNVVTAKCWGHVH